jgi:transcriptional regulator GlxA family with amidase domain
MLAFRNCQILDVVGPLQILAGANDEREAASPAYSLTLLAEKKGVLRTSGGLALVADGPYAALPADIDTLMIAGGGAVEDALEDPRILAAIRKGAKRARRIVSICSGAFLLAATGLLKNRRATTHWRSVGLLKERHPDIAVERDALYVRDGRVWTSAGVTAGMDLALALLREDLGDEVALSVARRHVLFLMRPGGQSQFSAHLESEAFQKGRLAPLLRWIPEHVGDALDVSALAERANMSERSFARIFARETGDTPARYVERARLDAARRLLTGTDLPQSVVAERSGFGSEERMRRAFHRQLKVSPAAFRARFQPEGELR